MNEIANATTTKELSSIDSLAMQARALRLSINVNMWQLARVFIEAKELVPHGEWQDWLKENADVSVRTAEDMIASYKRFGGRAQFEGLSPSKTFKLLPLPSGTEDQFMQDHDVSSMSTREVQEAVKKVREESMAAIEAAERRAKVAELNASEAAAKAADQYAAEKRRLEQEIEEAERTIQDQQDDYNRLQAEYLNVQSAAARGDAERTVGDMVTVDSFAAAVRAFMGAAARVPYMADAFSEMHPEDRREFARLISTIKGWVYGAEKAINTIQGEVLTVG